VTDFLVRTLFGKFDEVAAARAASTPPLHEPSAILTDLFGDLPYDLRLLLAGGGRLVPWQVNFHRGSEPSIPDMPERLLVAPGQHVVLLQSSDDDIAVILIRAFVTDVLDDVAVERRSVHYDDSLICLGIENCETKSPGLETKGNSSSMEAPIKPFVSSQEELSSARATRAANLKRSEKLSSVTFRAVQHFNVVSPSGP